MPNVFNNQLRQIILLALIIMLGLLLATTLYIFLPGFLGGITLFILTRKLYYKLTIQKKWGKGITAVLFIFTSILVIAIPFYFSLLMVLPKISQLVNKQQELIAGLVMFSKKIETYIGWQLFTTANAESMAETSFSYVPSFLNSTVNILSNLVMLFFLLYYLLYSGKQIENYLGKLIPLNPGNIERLAHETDMMIRANAIGIPVISIVHGAVATIGYLILGIQDWGMWGVISGIFSFFPFVGVMIIWVPLSIYLYSTNQHFAAIGLVLYSILFTGNVEYITRLGLLKRIGNVHPLVTILGVIVGLKLFGFMGLIFGPLLISYFIILMKIYINEFSVTENTVKKTII